MALFVAVLGAMLWVTSWAASQIGILDPAMWEDYLANRWAVATLFDAYFGFLTFYCWVAYKERSWFSRVLWFVLIMGLGNIAMAVYMLIQLARWKTGEPVAALLLRKTA
jgi:hypothetical protein